MQSSPIDVSTTAWLQPFEHTGDVGFVVRARDAAELFARAAWGMFDLLTDLRTVRPVESRAVRVTADDQAALLVRWLSELNFVHATEYKLFSRFDVRKATSTAVEATVWGEAIDPARHAVYTEIKAVTFHGLAVEQAGGAWTARVLFDV
jgi:SHS2 domain-containing protein